MHIMIFMTASAYHMLVGHYVLQQFFLPLGELSSVTTHATNMCDSSNERSWLRSTASTTFKVLLHFFLVLLAGQKNTGRKLSSLKFVCGMCTLLVMKNHIRSYNNLV